MLKKLTFCLLFLTIATSILSAREKQYDQELRSTQNNSLLFHTWSIYSQFGEEGILEEVLKRINIDEGTFVEFSAFHDSCISNVRFLADRGWRGIFVDVTVDNLKEYRNLNQYIKPLAPILCLEELLYFKDIANLPQVSFLKDSSRGNKNNFLHMVNSHCCDKKVDVLSIDVAGFDDLIFEGMCDKPAVIIVKAGLFWTPILTKKISEEVAVYGVNQPFTVLMNIAQKQGYTPVCFTGNIIFVRNDLIENFKEINTDPIRLWMDCWHYFSKKQPQYIAWIKQMRETYPYIRELDPHVLPSQ